MLAWAAFGIVERVEIDYRLAQSSRARRKEEIDMPTTRDISGNRSTADILRDLGNHYKPDIAFEQLRIELQEAQHRELIKVLKEMVSALKK